MVTIHKHGNHLINRDTHERVVRRIALVCLFVRIGVTCVSNGGDRMMCHRCLDGIKSCMHDDEYINTPVLCMPT